MNDPIAVIKKNSMDEIRVSSREYKGHRFIDIRVFTDPDTGTDKIPAKKGIALRPDLAPELIAALQKALEAGPGVSLLRAVSVLGKMPMMPLDKPASMVYHCSHYYPGGFDCRARGLSGGPCFFWSLNHG